MNREQLLDLTTQVRRVAGVPGLVDNGGVLRFAPNLPGVVELRLRDELSQRLPGTHLRFENDATWVRSFFQPSSRSALSAKSGWMACTCSRAVAAAFQSFCSSAVTPST